MDEGYYSDNLEVDKDELDPEMEDAAEETEKD